MKNNSTLGNMHHVIVWLQYNFYDLSESHMILVPWHMHYIILIQGTVGFTDTTLLKSISIYKKISSFVKKKSFSFV